MNTIVIVVAVRRAYGGGSPNWLMADMEGIIVPRRRIQRIGVAKPGIS
jgi:hypothetical protein